MPVQQLWGADHADSRHGQDTVQAACCAAHWKHLLLHRHQGGTCECVLLQETRSGAGKEFWSVELILVALGHIERSKRGLTQLWMLSLSYTIICHHIQYVINHTCAFFAGTCQNVYGKKIYCPVCHMNVFCQLICHVSLCSWHWSTDRAKTTRCALLHLLAAQWRTTKKRWAKSIVCMTLVVITQ